MANWIIGAVVFGIVALAARKVYKDHKAKKGCGCGCANCPIGDKDNCGGHK